MNGDLRGHGAEDRPVRSSLLRSLYGSWRRAECVRRLHACAS